MLERELNKYKSKIENNEIKLSKDIQNNNVINSILEKDKEIKELRLKLSRYPIIRRRRKTNFCYICFI